MLFRSAVSWANELGMGDDAIGDLCRDEAHFSRRADQCRLFRADPHRPTGRHLSLCPLSAQRIMETVFGAMGIGDEAWRKWSNIHPWLIRHGVCLADLGSDQREAALALLQESMSASGYRTA